jgi:outer membrane biosynthesis protein TonB
MTLISDPSGTGLGGPGMWDPMPLTPPVKPPAKSEELPFIWTQPEPAAPAKKERAPARARPKKRTVRKKAVKKKAKKKAAKRKKPVRRKKATRKKATRKKKSSGRAKKRR